jgi:2-phospho-L-lactate guanylyltransferase
MRWVAVVPLKGGGARKSRLAARLDPADRVALADRMARHVVACLAASPEIGEIRLLSPAQIAIPGAIWEDDANEGLNAALDRLRERLASPLLVIHGDLPLLGADDIAALLVAAAKAGVAIAPDRHDAGTNALAVADARRFPYGFGADSFARHRAHASDAAIVRRVGLSHDIDTPDDLDAALARGFSL